MLMPGFISMDYSTEFGKWWYNNLTNAVSYNPFQSIVAVLWVTLAVIVTVFFIYLFNYKITFRKLEMEVQKKKKLAMSIAVFTAPYLFYLPTRLFAYASF
jgi:hypothetical protein